MASIAQNINMHAGIVFRPSHQLDHESSANPMLQIPADAGRWTRLVIIPVPLDQLRLSYERTQSTSSVVYGNMSGCSGSPAFDRPKTFTGLPLARSIASTSEYR